MRFSPASLPHNLSLSLLICTENLACLPGTVGQDGLYLNSRDGLLMNGIQYSSWLARGIVGEMQHRAI
jgi:hypothetical protein